MRVCCRCAQAKPVEELVHRWYKGQYVPRNYCKACDAEQQREYKQKNPEKVRLNQRKTQLKRKFGITIDMYNEMLEKQQSRCAVCKVHVSDTTKDLAVDHCHDTGRVRGLLCGKCNMAIGLLNDDVQLVRSVLCYLENEGVAE